MIPFAVFVCMFLIWWTRGRDPIGRGTVVPQYEEPRGLPPALLSALLHQRVAPRDVIATLLDLARRGYITLAPSNEALVDTENQGDVWSFTRTKRSTGDLLPFERTMLKNFASSGETVVFSGERGMYEMLFFEFHIGVFKELAARRWFVSNPSSVRVVWFILAGIILFGSLFFSQRFGISFFLSGLISAIIIGFFGWFMPKTTKDGAMLVEEIEGLKLFLEVTEKERLAFHDAPEKRPEQFSRLLAAAVALGVEKAWAKQFEGMMLPKPSYFHGSSSWSSLIAIQGVNQLSSKFSWGVSSRSSGSSGFSGGSSGGGFGGGGGGSW